MLLPRGTILRDGDQLRARGRRDRRGARRRREPVGRVARAMPHLLTRGRVPPGQPARAAADRRTSWRATQHDHVLDDMVRGLGSTSGRACAPFEPEAGAFAEQEHDHEHAHEHGHEHEHGTDTSTDTRHEHGHGRHGTDMPQNLIAGRARCRLLQLVSPTLPVGAFAYSQGLEPAVERRLDHRRAHRSRLDRRPARSHAGVPRSPAPARLHAAWRRRRSRGPDAGADSSRASRTSLELRAEDRQLGAALARLLDDLGVAGARRWIASADVTYAGDVRSRRRALADPARTPRCTASRSHGSRRRPARRSDWCRSARAPASASCSSSARAYRPSSRDRSRSPTTISAPPRPRTPSPARTTRPSTRACFAPDLATCRNTQPGAKNHDPARIRLARPSQPQPAPVAPRRRRPGRLGQDRAGRRALQAPARRAPTSRSSPTTSTRRKMQQFLIAQRRAGRRSASSASRPAAARTPRSARTRRSTCRPSTR